jgi:hypothetical protein
MSNYRWLFKLDRKVAEYSEGDEDDDGRFLRYFRRRVARVAIQETALLTRRLEILASIAVCGVVAYMATLTYVGIRHDRILVLLLAVPISALYIVAISPVVTGGVAQYYPWRVYGPFAALFGIAFAVVEWIGRGAVMESRWRPSPGLVGALGFTGLALALFNTIAAVLSLVSYRLAAASIERRRRRNYCEDWLVSQIGVALYYLLAPRQSFDLYLRASTARELEVAARIAERDLPSAYSSLGIVADSFQAQCSGLASTLRGFALRLAWPTADAQVELRRQVSTLIYLLTEYRYHDIRLEDVPLQGYKASSKLGIRARVAAALRNLSIIIAPIFGLGIIKAGERILDRPLTGNAMVYLLVGSGAWSFVSFLAIVDPLFREKVANFREVLSYYPGMRGGKDQP